MHPFCAYSPADWPLPLPEGHRFPVYKYAAVRERVRPLLPVFDTPQLAWAEAVAVHDPLWLRRWRRGEITRQEERELGFPWSEAAVVRSMRAAGGSLAALKDALEVGWGANLAGGTHHAFRDRASGFCLVNDAAILTQRALQEGWARRVAVVDLDVHQGDGTAALLATEPRAFTISVHGERNYPFRKQQSSLDIGMDDGTGDIEYLNAMDKLVFPALEAFRPDLIVFLAGADVLAGDRFGRFELSLNGLHEHNRRVFAWAKNAGVPIVSVMAGGYNVDANLLVAGHASMVEVGLEAML